MILWEIATGRVRRTFTAAPGNRIVMTLAVSPGGRVIAAGTVRDDAPEADKHRIHFWDLKSGKLLATAKGHPAEIIEIVFSRDGCTLASASRDRTVRLWDVPAAE